MKKLLFIFLVCTGYGGAEAAQPLTCTQKGAVFERANYDSKGKLDGYTQQLVEQCDSTDDGLRVVNRLTALDLEHNPVGQNAGEQAFPAEQIEHIVVRPDDMALPLDLASLPFSEGVEIAISGDEYVIPYALEPGQSLPDKHFVFTASGNDHQMSFKITIDKRMVEACETIQTPAGTYDTFKVCERMAFKLFIFKASMKMVTWYAPGIGVVRKELRRKGGKVESRSELIAVRLPEVD